MAGQAAAKSAMLSRIREAIGGDSPDDTARQAAVRERLERPPLGVIPARGQLPPAEKINLFIRQAEAVHATVERVAGYDALPESVSRYLRERNLPARIRMGADQRLRSADWSAGGAPEVLDGPSDGADLAGLSHAAEGVAETGTLVLTAGADNPTTINFLPEYHIAVIAAADIEGDMEAAWARLRQVYGKGHLSRVVNFVTGPSRSADIEQTLLLGAHGPRALHIIVVEEGQAP